MVQTARLQEEMAERKRAWTALPHWSLALAAATVPIVVFAAIIVLSGLETLLRSPYVIATTSIVFGFILWHADRRVGEKTGVTMISWKEGMMVGLAQALSIVPGTSNWIALLR